MKKAPVKLTDETERYLRDLPAKPVSGMEPALVWIDAASYTRDQSGKLLGCCEGPRVALGWYKAGQRPRDSFYDLCGCEVSIMPSTVDHIQGKVIERKRVEMAFEGGSHAEYILSIE